jgi:GTP-binding protein EngB required for normal cell division
MIEFLHYHTLPFTVTLTKADKLSKMKLKEHLKAIAADLYLAPANMLATSSETGYGKDDVLRKLREIVDLANSPIQTEEEIEDEE